MGGSEYSVSAKNNKKYILIEKSCTEYNYQLHEKFLREERLLKTLSILVSGHNLINVPPTLLLLEKCDTVLSDVISRWGVPLMIRLDYKTLPKNKPLGGIALGSRKSIVKVCDFLFKEECYPVLHPNIERFDDEYSVGISIKPYDYECLIEVVGSGFDASDLRLGASTPHETIKLDSLGKSLIKKSVVSRKEYSKTRKDRIDKIIKLSNYTEYVSREGRLLSSLSRFCSKVSDISEYEMKVPKGYRILPEEYLIQLKKIIGNIQRKVMDRLPLSSECVASLSYIRKKGWILWDIYSKWYSR